MHLSRYLPVAVFLLVIAAAPAVAQVAVSPFIGVTYGGDTVDSRFAYGGTLSFGHAVGLDVDFGFAPNFFGDEDTFLEFDSKLNITTLMFNLRVGGSPSGGGVSPFVSGGAGLMRASVSTTGGLFDEVTRNDFALNVGGGIAGYFGEHVGLRGDIRYFRSLEDEGDDGFIFDPRDFDLGDFDFWRATVGVSFRF